MTYSRWSIATILAILLAVFPMTASANAVDDWNGIAGTAMFVNITPIAGNVSVGPYSSTAMPARRFVAVVALERGRVAVGLSDVAKL